ncbi:hypothetical protein AG1IA_02582 [Rhizoctonia solani AG-1 IA]|uniref:Uncharacterized protein n=1 Tax=Thanatephorus cucumeris (strain AG1-IA) TaxID=983506 RepID=L8X314_THACA|nr:hypothetical protein AG1IA_02582 [Rhizoctonia solani AG-1 IA]
MDTLSRREEDTLLKSTKAQALKDCDELVKPWHGHAGNNTRNYKHACINSMSLPFSYFPVGHPHALALKYSTCPENMEKVRAEYVRLRRQPAEP